jgi:hypothetical protein
MEQLRNTEILTGVKAIYRSGDVIYRDPSLLSDDITGRPIDKAKTNQKENRT